MMSWSSGSGRSGSVSLIMRSWSLRTVARTFRRAGESLGARGKAFPDLAEELLIPFRWVSDEEVEPRDNQSPHQEDNDLIEQRHSSPRFQENSPRPSHARPTTLYHEISCSQQRACRECAVVWSAAFRYNGMHA